ncbi:conserved hypothetical protein [Desulfamplus magnetovallimortis]|uniref:DUF3786 domain-containing protein n=1 Tax=Desulfamplus magnetovallimortis TaxID=1246637 RepID=A0A1W1H7T7_9BACT|nr:DUF3786 domain-containing protein [Desulfamplus magnetovallimortis]SLM28541.1 conserved hypothetical protein [Desulfamplus magnetovallimortis]
MPELIDRIFFDDLKKQSPEDVCKRTLSSWNQVERCYEITVWNQKCVINPEQYKIDWIKENGKEENKDRAGELHEYFSLFAIHYLLTSKEINLSEKWISEKDIPGGSTFFRGPHEVPTNLVTQKFSKQIDKFKERCEAMHGTPIKMADAAYKFIIAPRIPVALLFWDCDEDFPAEAKLLYDKTIIDHLALDIIFALAVGFCEQFAGEAIN